MKPLMDEIWNAAGFHGSIYYRNGKSPVDCVCAKENGSSPNAYPTNEDTFPALASQRVSIFAQVALRTSRYSFAFQIA